MRQLLLAQVKRNWFFLPGPKVTVIQDSYFWLLIPPLNLIVNGGCMHQRNCTLHAWGYSTLGAAHIKDGASELGARSEEKRWWCDDDVREGNDRCRGRCVVVGLYAVPSFLCLLHHTREGVRMNQWINIEQKFIHYTFLSTNLALYCICMYYDVNVKSLPSCLNVLIHRAVSSGFSFDRFDPKIDKIGKMSYRAIRGLAQQKLNH